MSALASPSNSFSAHLALAAGVSVSINAPTMADLANVVGKLQPTEAANDAGRAPIPTTSKAAKPAATPAATPAPSPEPQGNGSASTGTPASALGAAGGSEASGDEKRPTYDDVRERVLKLAKISRETATGALGKFGVDHANKLKLEDYAAFIANADELLKVQA